MRSDCKGASMFSHSWAGVVNRLRGPAVLAPAGAP